MPMSFLKKKTRLSVLDEELLKEQKTGGEEAEEAAEDKEIKAAYEKDKDWEI